MLAPQRNSGRFSFLRSCFQVGFYLFIYLFNIHFIFKQLPALGRMLHATKPDSLQEKSVSLRFGRAQLKWVAHSATLLSELLLKGKWVLRKWSKESSAWWTSSALLMSIWQIWCWAIYGQRLATLSLSCDCNHASMKKKVITAWSLGDVYRTFFCYEN